MELPRVIFIDDEQCMRDTCKMLLIKSFGENRAFEIEFYDNPESAVQAIRRNPFNVFLVVLDHHFRQADNTLILGSDYIKSIKRLNSYIEVIMMSADETEESLRLWLRNGADKILYKEGSKLIEKIQVFVTEALTRFHSKFGGLLNQGSSNLLRIPESLKKIGMVSVSNEMKTVADLALQCAKSDLSVFIMGETGTGKELVAKAIHQNSDRKNQEFRTIDCTQFKHSQIIASELFGSEKGAFTGAESKVGLFEVANGGTVFLDEIHHLGEEAQAMLLRFLQDRMVRRVGGKTEKRVDVRLVFAGKPLLKEYVQNGKFLPDLLYRMKEVKIDLPRLSDRKDDLEVLSFHFLDQANAKQGVQKRFHPDTLKLFNKYDWPGNVRELENLIKRLTVLASGAIILPEDVRKFGELELEDFDGEVESIHSFEELQRKHDNEKRELILKAYGMSDFNTAETARLLGLARSSLRSLSKSLGISEIMENVAIRETRSNRSEVKRVFANTLKSLTTVLDREA